MKTNRVDEAQKPTSLIERISSLDDVSHGLTQRTKDDYARKIFMMAKKIASAGNGNLTPASLAAHLQELVTEAKVAQSTARSLKAAAIFWLAEEAQSIVAQGRGDLREYEIAYNTIRSLATRALPNRTQETSGTKLKYFPKAVFESLISYANQTPQASNIGILIAFLRANLMVGLRPSEWFGAQFMTYLHRTADGDFVRTTAGAIKSSIALKVENAKATHGRANGEYREILLEGVSDTDLASLIHMWEIVNSYAMKNQRLSPEQRARAFFKPLQQTMTNALKRLGYPKHALPTTYSTRHQAVANAKFSNMSDREIAALFGHCSISTAKCHYGKKVNGWKKTNFKPSQESIQAVRVKNVQHDLANPGQRVLETAFDWNRSRKA